MILINEAFKASLPLWVKRSFISNIRNNHQVGVKLDQLEWVNVEPTDLPFNTPLKQLGSNTYMILYSDGSTELYDSEFNGPDDITFKEALELKGTRTGHTLEDIVDCGYLDLSNAEIDNKDKYVSDRDITQYSKGKNALKGNTVYWDREDNLRDRSGYRYDNRKYVTKLYRQLLDEGNLTEFRKHIKAYYKSSIDLLQSQLNKINSTDAFDDTDYSLYLKQMSKSQSNAKQTILNIGNILNKYDTTQPITPYVRNCVKLVKFVYTKKALNAFIYGNEQGVINGCLNLLTSLLSKDDIYSSSTELFNTHMDELTMEYMKDNHITSATINSIRRQIHSLFTTNVNKHKMKTVRQSLRAINKTIGFASIEDLCAKVLAISKSMDSQQEDISEEDKDEIMEYVYQLCNELDTIRDTLHF